MDEGGNALVFLLLFRQGARRGGNGGTVLRVSPLPERLPFTKFLIYRNYI